MYLCERGGKKMKMKISFVAFLVSIIENKLIKFLSLNVTFGFLLNTELLGAYC